MNYQPTNLLWKLLLLTILGTGCGLRAQELTVLGGFTTKENFGKFSGTWQVDYRQYFTENFGASVAYVNEGHLPGHHRDGNAGELWLRLPLFQDHLSVALGAGAYYYYDTVYQANGDSADIHGTAPIYSLSATAYLSNRVFARLMVNRIAPSHDVTVTTAAVGLGFWFGRDKKPTPGKLGDAPAEQEYVTENEVTLFGGQSVVNTFLSPSAIAYAAEYRRGFLPHLDGTATAIYEGDPEIARRSGIAFQAWAVNTFFHENISMGIGAGPYVYIDRKNPRAGNPQNPAAVAPLVSLTMALKLADHWVVRLNWDRVVSSYNRDSDIFLAGIGYRWGGSH